MPLDRPGQVEPAQRRLERELRHGETVESVPQQLARVTTACCQGEAPPGESKHRCRVQARMALGACLQAPDGAPGGGEIATGPVGCRSTAQKAERRWCCSGRSAEVHV